MPGSDWHETVVIAQQHRRKAWAARLIDRESLAILPHPSYLSIKLGMESQGNGAETATFLEG
jgi:hypothetical protein